MTSQAPEVRCIHCGFGQHATTPRPDVWVCTACLCPSYRETWTRTSPPPPADRVVAETRLPDAPTGVDR